MNRNETSAKGQKARAWKWTPARLLVGIIVVAVCTSFGIRLIFGPRHAVSGAAFESRSTTVTGAEGIAPPSVPTSGPARFTRDALVYVSKEAMDRGGKLFASGAYKSNPEMFVPLLSCTVSFGTPVTVIDASPGRREIAVDAGPKRGCNGWVEVEQIGAR